MYYVYVLESLKDFGLYIGFSGDLKARFRQHQNGESQSTKYRGPWRLIYYEACLSKTDALMRERYLKSTWGRRYLKNRLQHSSA